MKASIDPKYQVFVANHDGWAWQGHNLEKAKEAAQMLVTAYENSAWVVDTSHGGVIFMTEKK